MSTSIRALRVGCVVCRPVLFDDLLTMEAWRRGLMRGETVLIGEFSKASFDEGGAIIRFSALDVSARLGLPPQI